MLRIFKEMLVKNLPLSANIQLNWVGWSSLLALTLLTTLAFGAFPAILAARTDIDAGLKVGGRSGSGDRNQNRARAVLLMTEVALSITLLIGAGLMMRTMYALRHVPLGFRSDHLIVTNLTIPNDLYKDQNVASAVWQPLIDSIRRLPGVETAALSNCIADSASSGTAHHRLRHILDARKRKRHSPAPPPPRSNENTGSPHPRGRFLPRKIHLRAYL
jgi:hypothetical protein